MNKELDDTVQATDLFGEPIAPVRLANKSKRQKTLFDDYEGFISKFKRKRTTDDCYTPPEVYDCVLSYVRRKTDIDGLEIIRPFYPDMDYRDVDYRDTHVVIDNPPFSIISKIVKFYIEHEVKFFLFAPHLTLFSTDADCTHLVCGADIIYENGAVIKTSFLTNLMGNIAVLGDAELYEELTRIKDKKYPTQSLPKYRYPAEVLTVSNIYKLVSRGVSMSFTKSEVKHIRQLDSQRASNKTLFGAGYLISERAANEKTEAEKAVAENLFKWELSLREREIIKSLGK